jgi:hypothetical protein
MSIKLKALLIAVLFYAIMVGSALAGKGRQILG